MAGGRTVVGGNGRTGERVMGRQLLGGIGPGRVVGVAKVRLWSTEHGARCAVGRGGGGSFGGWRGW